MAFYRCMTNSGGGGGGGTSAAEIIEGTSSIVTDATKVKAQIFYQDSVLTSFDGPNVTEVATQAFRQTGSLTSLTLGALTKVENYAFYQTGATGATFDVDLNNATVATQAFFGSKVRNVTGTWNSAGASCLRNCTQLKKVEFNLSAFPNDFLYGDTALEEIYLSYQGGVVTATANALNSVPNTCKVYVPAALKSSYQADTVWGRFDIQELTT